MNVCPRCGKKMKNEFVKSIDFEGLDWFEVPVCNNPRCPHFKYPDEKFLKTLKEEYMMTMFFVNKKGEERIEDEGVEKGSKK